MAQDSRQLCFQFEFEMMKRVNTVALAKIAFGGVLVGVLAFFTQDNVKWESLFAEPPSAKQFSESKIQIETLDLPEALRLFYSKTTLFLDAREKRYFDFGSIRGAENLTPETLKTINSKVIERFRGKSAVVIYCNDLNCGVALYCARQLMDLGLTNVKVYMGGWAEWRSCRLPMTMSDAMKKDEAAHDE